MDHVSSDGRKGTANRESVLRAAVALADEGGLDAVTMRELGRRLGLEAASLYNHVSGKADLLEAMADLAMSEIEAPEASLGWKEAMRAWAASARRVLARHRWAAGLLDSRDRASPARLSYVDGILAVLLGSGLSTGEAANAALSLDAFVNGFERRRTEPSTGAGADGAPDRTADARRVLSAIREGSLTSAERVAAEYSLKPFDMDAAFDFGLALMLDGLERVIDRRLSPLPRRGGRRP